MANIRRSLAEAGIYFDKLYINQVGTAERRVSADLHSVTSGVFQQSNHRASNGEKIAKGFGQSVAEAVLRFGCEANIDGNADW